MAVIGKPRSYFKKFLFTVEIPGVGFAGFQKAGPLKGTVGVVEQWEGGAIAADKSPGRYKQEDITLERGATTDQDLWQWFKMVANVAANSGVVDPKYKRDLTITQRDRDGTVLRTWTVHQAWPSAFEAGDWDNTADSNTIESVTIVSKWADPNDDAPAPPQV